LATNLFLAGCVAGAPKYTSAPPHFEGGLTALGQKDFALASYHFAELAKEGNPAAMNNLGVALLMVDRRDEAVYWFNLAARYGNVHARDTLARLGESVPSADLVGRHPTQLQREATDKFVAALIVGGLFGVTLYYANKTERLSPNFDPSLLRDTPPIILTPNLGRVEGTDTYTGKRYTGTVDSFHNVTLRPALEPGGDAYRGTLNKSGFSTLRNFSGAQITVGSR
jgi:hypothetical protein